MADLQTDIRYLKGVGEAHAKHLQKLGITDVASLLRYFPRSYEDRTVMMPVRALQGGETCCVCATVANDPRASHIRKGLDLLKFRAMDSSGFVDITYFNQPYLRDKFHRGDTFVFYGKVEKNGSFLQMTNPLFEAEDAHRVTGRIMPVYPLTAGVSQNLIGKIMEQALHECGEELEEFLPEEVRREHNLCHIRFAYDNIHFPQDAVALQTARRRMVFEELYLLCLGMRTLRSSRDQSVGQACREVSLDPLYDAIPFSLTGAQKRAIDDITRDMCRRQPMNRLCQGDVGSGKTMVAAAAIFFAARNGLQSALMAPTEILAEQHYHSLAPMLENMGIRCALLTASTPSKQRKSILAQLENGEIAVAIGTHALISSDVVYGNLGLVVTDEQHRFGVNQRSALSEKGNHPHLLVMSATPIPRTLALMIYGDLDVSVLDELPPGRQKIDTYAVPTSYHKRLYAFLHKQIDEGRQAYIVCPMVEENGDLPDERKAVNAYAEMLQKTVFPDLTVSGIHGKMKAKEKEELMRRFSDGEVQILVSTTVIEVGVDVPNATVMLIENAECFGLSQLHQLRGRVGRGKHKSYCVLVSDNTGEENRQRLQIMTETNNGFTIAEEDLKLRGPGDFFGQRQHGLPPLRVADLECDMELLHEAQSAAEKLLREDGDLNAHPLLRERVEALFALAASAMN